MTKLLISIVTWNSAKTIESCIKSISIQNFSDYKLVVLDNNSSDNTVKLLQKFDHIHIIESNENTGFCGGHNKIIGHFKSEYVLLVNPDIILLEGYIDRALKSIESVQDVGTLCGLLIQEDSESGIIDSAGMEFHKSRRFLLRYNGLRRNSLQLKLGFVDGADGALPLYRRSMIDDISIDSEFFDNMFFAHKEDWDVSWRANLFGWKTLFNPQCIAIHPRVFKQENIKVRKSLSSTIKMHAVKNQLLLLIKNEKYTNRLRSLLEIVPRQFMIFIYILFFERKSLNAYYFIFSNRKEILRKRSLIQSRAKQIYHIPNKKGLS